MDWYLEVFRKYAVFEGRARRKEFWYFILFNIIVMIILTIMDKGLGTFTVTSHNNFIGLLTSIYTLFAFIPSISVTVRRLHDTDRSGWWFFIIFIPIIGSIVLFIFEVLRGTIGPNKYGVDPIID